MTATHKGILLFIGLMLGAVGCWALGLAYLSLIETDVGSLAFPLALSLIGAFFVGRRPSLQSLALGLAVGAVLETAFFLWLFAEWSRGLGGL